MRNELKTFWDKVIKDSGNPYHDLLTKDKLGMFFWGRGGKIFADAWGKDTWENLIGYAKHLEIIVTTRSSLNARDFLDALDCLGSEKVKELIKQMEMK